MIAPSILSSDFANFEKEIRAVEAGGADWIHVDVMDGHFVPQISMGVPIVKSLRSITSLPIDVHLMVNEPEKFIEQFAVAGADWISFHFEATPDPFRVISKIKQFSKKAGIALNPLTPVSVLKESLEFLDYVLIMTVSPGFGGQKFIDSMYEKIKELRNEIDNGGYNVLIQVDGGIKDKNILKLKKAGCDVFVAGSFVFDRKSPANKVKLLKEIIYEKD